MKQENINKIVEAIDDIIDRYQAKEEIIFDNDSERKRLLYAALTRRSKNWESSKKCIYRGCHKNSIAKSHVIQRSTSLKLTSENGHVLTPSINRSTGKIEMSKIGINEASTFPGFCKEHELLFQDFEKNKGLTEMQHFQSQIYRTICREIVIKHHHLSELKRMKKDYLNYRNEKLLELFKNELDGAFVSENRITLKGFEFEYTDTKIQFINKKIKYIENDLKDFKRKFYDGIIKDMEHQTNKISSVVIEVDTLIPVSLSGRGNFFVTINNKQHNVILILNILPYLNKTHIVITGIKEDEKYIKAYLGQFRNSLEILNMLETWMIHGTDHWFIKPSVWNSIRPDKKEIIIEDILDTTRNIGCKYNFSIFNRLRWKILDNLKGKRAETTSLYDIQKFISEETKRLTD